MRRLLIAVVGLWLFLGWQASARADDFASLCADRAAIERVYDHHRSGEKSPVEQTLPEAALEKLVREDQAKEAALKKVYGVEITPALLDAEVRRINATTRAPEMLNEIKTALGNDPGRFANAFAKPFLVERLLRQKFDFDDTLHGPQRREAEQARTELLEARQKGADYAALLALLRRHHAGEITELTWQLTAPPAETTPPDSETSEIKKRFGPNAQALSSQETPDTERKFYFADLPDELQNVLRAQLHQPGDVSAVIETPRGFLLYVARKKTETELCVAGLTLPKRDFEQWLAAQSGK
jgi:hypothetical protein